MSKIGGTYKIQCADTAQFLQIIAGLVKEGICFNASGESLVIECTGGF